MKVTEITGPRKMIFNFRDKVVYPLGKKSKSIRVLYWRLSGRYLWGVYNWLADFGYFN